MCMSCGKKLHAHELIPLFSYLIQRGKCRSCKSSLSIQYPIIEALSGFVVLILALTLSPILGYSMAVFITLFVYALFAFSLLLVISVYDIRHKVIPNALSLAFALLFNIHFYFGSSCSKCFGAILWSFLGPSVCLTIFGFKRKINGIWRCEVDIWNRVSLGTLFRNYGSTACFLDSNSCGSCFIIA